MSQTPPPLPQQPPVAQPPIAQATATGTGTAAAAQQQGNGATPLFKSLRNINQVLNPNFNQIRAFQRAMKVFYLSYPNLSGAMPQFQQDMYRAYVATFQRLYGVPAAAFQNPALMAEPFQAAQQETISISVTVKAFTGSDQIVNPRLVISMGSRQIGVIDLNSRPYRVHYIKASFADIRDIRRNPAQHIVFSVMGDDWSQPNDPLNVLNYTIANTNPEGYEQLFNFGRGVQLRIAVDYVVTNENNMMKEDINNFHLNTINLMLGARLRHFNDRGIASTGHQQYSMKYKITYDRPFVSPDSVDMFWSAPPQTRRYSELVPESMSKSGRFSTVKFVDMQSDLQSSDELKKVCLCSEWCNWNAFFYYNPIYRFLVVRHNVMLMGDALIVPDMYLCLSVFYGCSTVYPRLPILQLMNSANDVRMIYLSNYINKFPDYADAYRNSYPNPFVMNAVAYNKLREDMNVQRLCHSLDVNPFSDLCIENLLNFYKVLIDLHNFHSPNPIYVDPALRDTWIRDLDLISRHRYGEFVSYGYLLTMQNNLGDFDYLFTQDYEYSQRVPNSGDGELIKRKRDMILSRTTNDSPFNVKIHMNDFMNTFASVYKFFAKVEPMLPKAHKTEAIQLMYDSYHQMEDEFLDFQQNRQADLTFRIIGLDANYQNFEQNFYVFYTLKIYFFEYEIQKQWINSGLALNSEKEYKQQVCDVFDMCWMNQHLQQTYSDKYAVAVVFPNTADFSAQFESFYVNYYGVPYQETIAVSQLMNDPNTLKDNVCEQLRKLYVWHKKDGNNRLKFTNIIRRLVNVFEEITDHSNRVFRNWIIPAISGLRHTTRFGVFDHLVYYLVKANCSMALNTMGVFFKQMHDLQHEELTERDVCYSLAKPGWVVLFRTFGLFMKAMDDILNAYLLFEDEFERIANTCDQTMYMIKTVYRQLYSKLSYEWVNELSNVFHLCRHNAMTVNRETTDLIILHFAVGVSFMSTFCDDFRPEFYSIRKTTRTFFATNPCPQALTQDEYTAINYLLDSFLTDRNAIQIANPFPKNIWTANQYLSSMRTRLEALTTNQFNLDLTQADTV